MPLNPQVEALLAMFAQAPPADLASITPAALRAANDQPMAFGPPPEVASVSDIVIPLPGRTLEARLYVPENAGTKPPLTVFFHGGGWVIGTLETHDGTSRALARASGSAVLSVAYRLAPEHPYPAAVDDCFETIIWAHDNADQLGIDQNRLAVAGDSAGANIAAATTILSRDRSGPALRHQTLFYPVTDADFSTPSYLANGGGQYFLGIQMMEWFWKQYLGDTPVEAAPLAAVLRFEDVSALPAATIITAEFDPLRDEGMAYADRLRSAGVEVDAAVADGMIHGFASMFDAVPDAHIWIDRAGARLRAALA